MLGAEETRGPGSKSTGTHTQIPPQSSVNHSVWQLFTQPRPLTALHSIKETAVTRKQISIKAGRSVLLLRIWLTITDCDFLLFMKVSHPSPSLSGIVSLVEAFLWRRVRQFDFKCNHLHSFTGSLFCWNSVRSNESTNWFPDSLLNFTFALCLSYLAAGIKQPAVAETVHWVCLLFCFP